jgi:hypothetical protein
MGLSSLDPTGLAFPGWGVLAGFSRRLDGTPFYGRDPWGLHNATRRETRGVLQRDSTHLSAESSDLPSDSSHSERR